MSRPSFARLALALVALALLGAPACASQYDALGDSLTTGVGASTPGTTDFVPQVRTFLSAHRGVFTLTNRGQSGAVAPDLAPAIPSVQRDQLTNGVADLPNVVTLTVGGDDALHIVGFDPGAETVAQFDTAYNAILSGLRGASSNPFVVVANVPDISQLPAAAGFSSAQKMALTAIIVQLNTAIATRAAQYSIPVVDLFDDPRSYNPANVSGDGFHPNDAGYAVLTQLFNATLDSPRVVTNTNDSGPGSLRQALTDADRLPGADTVTFDPTVFGATPQTITLTSGELTVGSNVTVLGPGANRLAVSGNNASRVLEVTTGTVALSGLTLTLGNAGSNGTGGGVLNAGTLTMSACVLSGSSALGANGQGGGIDNVGTMIVSRCTLANNSAGNIGGGILNTGTMTVSNSTLSGNSAGIGTPGNGGGIAGFASTLILDSCTLAGNSAGVAGGLYQVGGSVTVGSTIFNSPIGNNTFITGGAAITDRGYNLTSDGTGPNDGTTDKLNMDPKLGSLADNGGPTPTHALLPGSPAIQADFAPHFPLDQRGLPRPQLRADIGAFEAVLAIKGQLRGWGYNSNGQVGPGFFTPSPTYNLLTPVICPGLPNAIGISGGAFHSLGLLGTSALAWGYDSDGQLGNGASDPGGTQDVNAPLTVAGLTNVLSVSGGAFHSLALKSDGTVWAWGKGDSGQLGNNGFASVSTPVQVVNADSTPFTGVVAVSGGGQHSLALKTDGTVWAWGKGGNGQLGNNSLASVSTPVLVVNSDGSPFTGVVAIGAGGEHSLAVKADGSVWSWGYNANGELGNANNTTNQSVPVQVHGVGNAGFLTGIVSVSGNDQYSLALGANGTVYSWGANKAGQLGDGAGGSNVDGDGDSLVPVQVLDVGGAPNSALSNVVGISTSNTTGLALKSDGTVYTWGNGTSGQLGNNTVGSNSTSPVQVHGVGDVGFLGGIVALAGGGYHDLALQNQAPVANPDSYTTGPGGLTVAPAQGVLTNDTDTEGDTLSATVAVAPTHGMLTLNSDGSFVYTPTANYGGPDSFIYQVRDYYNVGNPATVTITVDNTPPTTTATLNPATPNGSSGFYTTPVTVTLTATDASGIAGTFYTLDGGTQQPYTTPFTVSTDGAHTITFFSTDNVGNTEAAKSVSFQIDATAPVTTATSLTTAQGQQITLSAADPAPGSGVANTNYSVDGGAAQAYTVPFTITGNGPHTVTFSSTDNAGNTEATKTLTFTININAPVTTATLNGTAGNNGFYKGPVTATLTATSQSSTITGTFYTIDGGTQQTYTTPFTISTDGTHTVTFFSTDAAGNTEATNTLTVKIDSAAPVTTASGQSTAQGQRVTLSATDNLSGVSGTTYAVDGGAQTPYTGPFTVTGNGPHTVTFSSTDNAGNTEATKTLTFTININAPVTTTTLSGPAGNNGYFKGTVTITLSATSQSSTVAGTFYTLDGGAQQTYTAPFPVSGGGNHTLAFFSTDSTGNTEATNTLTVKIDGAAPVTTATAQDRTVTLSATDPAPGSGVSQTVYSVDGGTQTTYTSPFPVSGFGAHTVTYHSTDNAGNQEADKTLTIPSATSPVLHTFPAGLQLFSVPEDYTGIPNDIALTTPGVKLAVWQPSVMQYALSPDAPADALRLGVGYWARFRQDTPLLDAGKPADTTKPFHIVLSKGWNMIGDPFPTAIPYGDISLEIGGRQFTLGQANSLGLLYGTLYAFPAGSTQYQTVSGGGSLQPYLGYWVYAYQDGLLTVSPTHISR